MEIIKSHEGRYAPHGPTWVLLYCIYILEYRYGSWMLDPKKVRLIRDAKTCKTCKLDSLGLVAVWAVRTSGEGAPPPAWRDRSSAECASKSFYRPDARVQSTGSVPLRASHFPKRGVTLAYCVSMSCVCVCVLTHIPLTVCVKRVAGPVCEHCKLCSCLPSYEKGIKEG